MHKETDTLIRVLAHDDCKHYLYERTAPAATIESMLALLDGLDDHPGGRLRFAPRGVSVRWWEVDGVCREYS